MYLSWWIVTTASLADSVNPCAISVLLLTVAFLIQARSDRRKILFTAGIYILGIFITYILIGLGILQVLTFFGIPKSLSRFGALILITTSVISLLEHFIPGFPKILAIPKFIKPSLAKLMHQATIPAFFALGVLVGLFEFPCTGGPYLLILTLLHSQATFTSGFVYLIYYNLIFILPLLVILAITSSPGLLHRVENFRHRHTATADLVASLLMLILGIIILITG